jgi:hypothetical protein
MQLLFDYQSIFSKTLLYYYHPDVGWLLAGVGTSWYAGTILLASKNKKAVREFVSNKQLFQQCCTSAINELVCVEDTCFCNHIIEKHQKRQTILFRLGSSSFDLSDHFLVLFLDLIQIGFNAVKVVSRHASHLLIHL